MNIVSVLHTQVLHDESGRMWLMLHSGSRNIGNVTAQYYDKIAQEQLAQQGIKVPGGLNYLEIASEHGQGYLQVSCLIVNSMKRWFAGRTCASVKRCRSTIAAVSTKDGDQSNCAVLFVNTQKIIHLQFAIASIASTFKPVSRATRLTAATFLDNVAASIPGRYSISRSQQLQVFSAC